MTEEINLEEARKALEVERAKRIEMCRLEVRAILEKYRMELRVRPIITRGGTLDAVIEFVEVNRPSGAS